MCASSPALGTARFDGAVACVELELSGPTTYTVPIRTTTDNASIIDRILLLIMGQHLSS